MDFFSFLSADMLPKSVESVFIFQEGSEGEPNVTAPTYDAIVVEQWTVIDVSGGFSSILGVAGFRSRFQADDL